MNPEQTPIKVPDISVPKEQLPTEPSKTIKWKQLIVFTLVSLIVLSVIAVARGYLNAVAWACGDVSCTTSDTIFIIITLISWAATFCLPGVAYYSIKNRAWKLPLIFLSIASLSAIYTLVTNPQSITSIANEGLVNLALSGIPQLMVLVIYAITVLIFLKKPSLPKVAKIVLSAVLGVLSLFIIASVLFPSLLSSTERGLTSVKFGSNLDKAPTGIIYYQSFTDPNNPDYDKGVEFNSISSNGERVKYNLPDNCRVADIVKTAALCFSNSGPNIDKLYYLNLTNNTSQVLNFKGVDLKMVHSGDTLKLTPDGKTVLAAVTGYSSDDYIKPKLYSLNVQSGEVKTVFTGTDTEHQINQTISSNDGNYYAFFYTALNQYRFSGDASVLVVDKDGNKIKELKSPSNDFANKSLKISDDSSKIFFWGGGNGDAIKYYLGDIKTGDVISDGLKEQHLGEGDNSGQNCQEEFDGNNSVYFWNNYEVTKYNLETKQRTVVRKLDEAVDCLYLNGTYASTRPSIGSSYVTFIIDLQTGKRTKLLDHSEFIEAWFN